MSARLLHLERLFPALSGSEYSKSSEADTAYNCFGFAVHDTKQYWQKVDVRGYYWPLKRDDRLEDWIEALRLNNFVPTDDWSLEAEFEKVCIYVNEEGSPEHVSRQLASGKWTSKIGRLEDIEHSTLTELECVDYGKPKVMLKRKRAE